MYSFTKLLLLASAAAAAPVAKLTEVASSPLFTLIAFHKGREFQYNMVKYNGTNLELARDEPAFFGHIEAAKGYTLTVPLITKADDSDRFGNYIDLDNYSYNEANVSVQNDGALVTNRRSPSTRFGIADSFLTYKDSNAFMACPVWTKKAATWGRYNMTSEFNSTWGKEHKNMTNIWNQNGTISDSWNNATTVWGTNVTMLHGTNITTSGTWLDQFDSFSLHAGSKCPGNVPGYKITLIVQEIARLNYNPNANSWDDGNSDTSNLGRASVFKRYLSSIA